MPKMRTIFKIRTDGENSEISIMNTCEEEFIESFGSGLLSLKENNHAAYDAIVAIVLTCIVEDAKTEPEIGKLFTTILC